MKKGGHYDASGLIEAQFEPGSQGRVLKNLLGIKSKREMDQAEVQEQFRALEELIRIIALPQRICEESIRSGLDPFTPGQDSTGK